MGLDAWEWSATVKPPDIILLLTAVDDLPQEPPATSLEQETSKPKRNLRKPAKVTRVSVCSILI